MKPGLLPFDEALRLLLARADAVAELETVSTMDACARVLAAPVRSTIDVPSMDNSQMDGYAVRAAEAVAGARLPVSQRIPAGKVGKPLQPGTVARVFTGAMVPEGADAVLMQEVVEADGDHALIREGTSAGAWIRRTGEDIRAGSEVLSAGQRLSPQAVGLAASVGLASLTVRRRVRVGCFFTGDELAMPGEPLRAGAIYNSNRFVLVSLLRSLGCEVTDLGIVPDSLAATRAALVAAARGNDLILTSGGMSVGEEDHVKPAVEAEGELQMWQIAIKPGKPLAYGRVRRGAAATATESAHFIGLPGNPVSAFVTFLMLVRPFVLSLQGCSEVSPLVLPLRAAFEWSKPDRRREFLRVRLQGDGTVALFPNQGSAVLTSTVWADGLVDNPPGQVIQPGDPVRYMPFSALLG